MIRALINSNLAFENRRHTRNMIIQSTPDNSNLQGKLKMVRVIGSFSYRELRTNDRKYVKNGVHCI